MLVFHLVILAVLLILLGIALLNSLTFPRARSGARPLDRPTVSVLVPARNEERTIASCVESLLRQDYRPMEVIVLDDDSEDRTGEILAGIAREHTEPLIPFRVIPGEPLPSGWLGKNRACARLAEESTGEWLLFLDADTTHRPDMVAGLLAEATERGASFLSAVPRQLVPTFWEKVVVPMAPFLYFSTLPNRLIPRRNHQSLSAANGQMILVSRSAYDAIGGHQAVRDRIVEDVELARLAKRMGLKTELLRADRVSDCRMYRNLREIVDGFSKNLYPGLGRRPVPMILFILTLLLLYVAPWIFLAASLINGNGPDEPRTYLPALQALAGITMRGLSDRAFGMKWWQGLFQPLSALTVAAIGLRSWRLWESGGGGSWKGRNVRDNQ